MGKSKYHHLIPRTYMSSWCFKGDSLNIKYKDGTWDVANKNKIAGINHYHSIIAGMPICTSEDCNEIYEVLKDFTVMYDGKVVSNLLELNSLFWDFDNWVIVRSDSTIVSKKKIKNAIEQVKIREIEEKWSKKYEDGWNVEKEIIESNVMDAEGDIQAFDIDYLMKFFTMMDWRSGSSNDNFMKSFDDFSDGILSLDDIDIPEEERELPFFETASDYMRHCLLLKWYRNFLNDEGPMYINALSNIEHTSFHFLIADTDVTFITSDNPVFVFERKQDGLKQGVLPITPHILMCQGRKTKDDDTYCVSHIKEETVRGYNNIIMHNAQKFIIVDDKNIEHF